MKKMSKWLTSLLIVTMALMMFGSSAFAAVVSDQTGTNANTSVINVQKLVSVTDANKLTADDTYTFAISEPTTAAYGLATAPDTTAATITGGFPSTVTLQATSTNKTSLTGAFERITFSAPGLYTFTVTETEKSNPNVKMDDSVYTVRVYVTYDETGHLKARTTIVKNVNGAAPSDADQTDSSAAVVKVAACSFTNTDNTDVTSLTVSKTATSNALSQNQIDAQGFSYNVVLANIKGTYVINYFDADGTITPAANQPTVTAAEANGTSTTTIVLYNGQKFSIVGLPYNVTYNVTEAGTTGWTPSYAITNGMTAGVTGSAEKSAELATGDKIVDNAGTTVAFTNDSTMTPPTAFMISNWPYIALGIFAVAGIALFLKKRNSAKESF